MSSSSAAMTRAACTHASSRSAAVVSATRVANAVWTCSAAAALMVVTKKRRNIPHRTALEERNMPFTGVT